MLTAIDHIAFAVSDLDAAVEQYRRMWGLEVDRREVVGSDGVEEAMLPLGGIHLQLLAPTSPNSSVARFLERRGEGLHHIAYRVADVGAALERLHSEGAILIDEQPRPGPRSTRIAFVHPKGNRGVLVELVQHLAPDS
ncbi:MAG: methylmalonyl-CoA epimerase [Actinomycetota bacterium]